MLKLNGEIAQARHKAAGVTEYVWRTSRDERVRSRHKALEGTRHAYSEPPVVAVQNAANMPIVGHLVGYRNLAKASAEIKRDIENIITANQAKSNGTINTNARKMGSLLAYIKSNTSKGAGVTTAGADPTDSSGSYTRTDADTLYTFTEAMLKTVAQEIFSEGGTPKLLVVPPGLKATVSAFA